MISEQGQLGILQDVIREKTVRIGEQTFLLTRVLGENLVLQATPDNCEVWKSEVLAEVLRRAELLRDGQMQEVLR